MQYEYNKQIEKNEVTTIFIRYMGRVDKIQEVIGFCNEIDDDELVIQLEGKQVRLIERMCHMYKVLYNVNVIYDIDSIANAGDLIYNRCQENINVLQEQIIKIKP